MFLRSVLFYLEDAELGNAVFWVLRTGAPWRDFPPEYGDWKNTHRRFCRWRDNGTWEHTLAKLMDMPDFEWLMIDSTHCKVHIPMRQEQKAIIRTWAAQKGVQYQDTFSRGCAWHAGQNHYYSGFLF